MKEETVSQMDGRVSYVIGDVPGGHGMDRYAIIQASHHVMSLTAFFAWRICGGFFHALLGHGTSASGAELG